MKECPRNESYSDGNEGARVKMMVRDLKDGME